MDDQQQQHLGDIIGAGGGGGGKDGGSGQSRNPVEAPNSLFSVAFARTVLLLGEGEIEGFPSGVPALDIFLDGTPIQRRDGVFNFKNVQIDYRLGTDSTQTVMPGFADEETTINVATKVSRDIGPVTRQIVDPDVDQCRVVIQFPSLQVIDANSGDTNPTSVQFQISLSTNGGAFSVITTPTISGKSAGQFQRAYQFPLPGRGPWQVRVERLTADSTSAFLSNDIIWQALTQITSTPLTYANSAVLGVRVDARQFSQIPNVTVRLRGRRVQIPSNYDPVNRTYTGNWDGTFKVGWTDNPAWVFRDIVRNPVYGCAHYLPTIDCDRWYLYSVSRYCDQFVPNGLGGTEPRFRCNVFLQNQGTIFETLNALASVFRGLIYYESGLLYLTQDRPGEAVQTFTEANVIQETDDTGQVTNPCFTYTGASRTARKSVVIANWDDPLQNYNSVVEYQQDDELLRRFGYNPIDLRLIGVTSRGQALRAAKFALFTNRYEPDQVTFRVGSEGLAASVGELIKISDPTKQGRRLAGRLRSVNLNKLVLDAALTLAGGITYTVTLVLPNGQTVTNPDGTTTTTPALQQYTVVDIDTTPDGYTELTIVNPTQAQAGSIWVIEWQDQKAQLYRILSISEYEPGKFQITAQQSNQSKYNYIDNDLPVVIPKDRFTVRDTDPPTDLKAQLVYRNGRVNIQAAWVAPQVDGLDDNQVQEYRYEYQQSDANQWQSTTTTAFTNGSIALAQFRYGQTYQFRVQSRNRLGQGSDWVEVNVAGFDPLPDISDPQFGVKVTHVNAADGSFVILIDKGSLPIPERLAGFRVWVKPTDAIALPTWMIPPDADGFYKISDLTPISGYQTFKAPMAATYSIRVGLASLVPGEPATAYVFETLRRDEVVPPTPTRFTVVEARGGGSKRFSWQQGKPDPDDTGWVTGEVTDISAYRIRYKQGGLMPGDTVTDAAASWAAGYDLISGGVPAVQNWYDTSLFENGQWLVMLKAVDAAGFESDNPAIIIINALAPLPANVVATAQVNPMLPTTDVMNAEVVMDPDTGRPIIQQVNPALDSAFGWYIDNNDLMSSLLITVDADGTYQNLITEVSGDVQILQTEAAVNLLTEDGNFLLAEQSAYAFADTAQGVTHPYAPFEMLTGDLYRVETRFRSKDGTPAVIRSISYQLDYPDLVQTFNDVPVRADVGVTVVPTKPFRQVTGVQVTIQDTGTGAASAVVVSKSVRAVTIRVIDAAGQGVASNVDITVQGY
jgi:Putative phage tail protein